MRRAKRVTNMEIDEISLVDKAANQHAMITIAKRAPEEEIMPELYDEDGQLLDENSLSDGQIVWDGDGNAYQFSLEADEDAEEDAPAEAKEPELVGKSAFFKNTPKSKVSKSFKDELMEELSKAYSDDDRDKVLSKAFSKIDEIQKGYTEMAEIAKSERDLRLTREYISKAAEYNVPVDPAELGPVLYRMAESMSYEDCSVIAKCLDSISDALFSEHGYVGGGDNDDIYSQVQARAVEMSKSADPASISKVFDEHPEAYDQYLADRRG